jgi:hypothetical protein
VPEPAIKASINVYRMNRPTDGADRSYVKTQILSIDPELVSQISAHTDVYIMNPDGHRMKLSIETRFGYCDSDWCSMSFSAEPSGNEYNYRRFTTATRKARVVAQIIAKINRKWANGTLFDKATLREPPRESAQSPERLINAWRIYQDQLTIDIEQQHISNMQQYIITSDTGGS